MRMTGGNDLDISETDQISLTKEDLHKGLSTTLVISSLMRHSEMSDKILIFVSTPFLVRKKRAVPINTINNFKLGYHKIDTSLFIR